MLSRSNLNVYRAEDAEIAQLLRGGGAFGSVAFSEKASITSDAVQVEPGYDDCLPIQGGGYWRDPMCPGVKETIE